MSAHRNPEIKAATHLASVEIIVGSIGHGFKIPLTGTALSFYQLYVLLGLMIREKLNSISVFNVSVTVALLKTLSPLGKKLTPMMAIAMQGFLLWLGTLLLGESLFGMAFGSVLFVCWSLIQTAIGYTLLYGFDFFNMLEFIQKELGQFAGLNLYIVIIGYLLLRILVALAIIVYWILHKNSSVIWSLDDTMLQRWQTRMTKNQGAIIAPVWKRAFRDLLNPFFFISLILMILFHLYKESSTVEMIWFVCRTLATGFVLFYLVRSDWVKRWLFGCFGKNRKFRQLYRNVYRVKKQLTMTKSSS